MLQLPKTPLPGISRWIRTRASSSGAGYQSLSSVRARVGPRSGCRPHPRHGLTLRFDLPGIDPASIEVTVDRGTLTVSAKRDEELAEGEKPYIRERVTGTFSRRIRLGDAIDSAKVEAGYEHGVLTVRVPLAEAAKPRKVEIQAEAPKGIAA